MKTFVVLASVLGLLMVGCGGGSSPGTDGGGGGSGGAASTGKGGSSGAAGAGEAGRAGGQGGEGGQLAGIPTACESCAETMCASTLLACYENMACTNCVQNGYQTCVTNNNSQYAAVCGCAKSPCPACAPYCP